MDIRRLDLNLLLVLDALFDEGSVTGAARRLKLSQPTVSLSLGRLRQALGDELFVRTPRGMSPTPRADRLRKPVRQIIETVVEEILPVEHFDPATAQRPFTFCLSDIGEMTFLPRIIERLRVEAPHVCVASVSLRPRELTESLEDGRVDLAIGYFPDLEAGIHQQGLFDHSFVCLARRAHPKIGKTFDIAQFLALDHLVVSAEGRSQEIFERAMVDRGASRRIVLRTPHFMSAPLLVAGSDMITTVPRAVGMAWAAQADLQLLEPPMDIPAIPLKQFWHRRFNDDRRLVWLRGLVADLFLGRDPFGAAARSPASPVQRKAKRKQS
jgi:DNA-binding transcriptional LysR family regulator